MHDRIKGVLFDLGETLLNYGQVDMTRMFKAGARLAYKHLERAGHRLPSFGRYHFQQHVVVRWSYLKSAITGREFDSLEAMVRLHAGMRIELSREEALELAWLWYRPLSRAAIVDPDTREVLAQLQEAGLALGLVSNTFLPGEVLDRHLEKEGLLRFLPIRVYSSQVCHRKPDPQIFQIAMEKGDLRPAETLFVGDSLKADVRGANRAGMISVLKDPLNDYRSRRIVPQYRIRRLRELLDIVTGHNGGKTTAERLSPRS